MTKIAGLVVFRTILCITILFSCSNLEARKYAAIVVDAHTGKILHAENPDRRVYPASLTKIMTLFQAFQALKQGLLTLDQHVPVSALAARQEPCKLGLKAGSTISVRDAIIGMVTKSANDAAVALSEAIAGSEARFAHLMTHQARHLGMKNTVFRNASGLPHPGQVTTVQDMALLSRALIHHFPEQYKYFATKVFNYKGTHHRNHNHLVGEVIGFAQEEPIIVDGIKTGWIRASGSNLAASARVNNRRLIGVVIGGENRHWRDKRMRQLLVGGFQGSLSRGARLVPAVAQLASLKETVAAGRKLQKKVRKAQAGFRAVTSTQKHPVASARTVTKTRKGTWRIQVGAFGRAKDALVALKNVQKKVNSVRAYPSQSVSSGKRKKMYRAQFLNMSQTQAKQACRDVRKRGFDCIVVPG